MFSTKTRLIACAALLLAFAGSLTASGQGQPDSRVSNAVKSLGYKYDVDDSGLMLVILPGGGEDKPRLLFLESRTQVGNSGEVRGMLSLAHVYNGALPAEAARMIKEVNAQLASGKFVAVDAKGGKTLVVFVTEVKADATPAELDAAMKSAYGIGATLSVSLGRLS